MQLRDAAAEKEPKLNIEVDLVWNHYFSMEPQRSLGVSQM